MASKPTPVKILVAGSVEGRFDELLAKVQSVHAQHGPFQVLFCVGEFFGPEPGAAEAGLEVLRGAKVPLPLYFICGRNGAVHLKPGEVAPNVHFLGPAGITDIMGLRVAYLSGVYDAAQNIAAAPGPGKCDGFFRASQISALRAARGSKPVDVLLTVEWPAGFAKHLPAPPPAPVQPGWGVQPIAALAAALAPRYHFSGQPAVHYARAPYLDAMRQIAVRFLALAHVGSTMRWLYAAQLAPAATLSPDELRAAPGATAAPFDAADEVPTETPAGPTVSSTGAVSMGGYTRWQLSSEQMRALQNQMQPRKRTHDATASLLEAPSQRSAHPPGGGRAARDERGPRKRTDTRGAAGGAASAAQDCWFCLGSAHVQNEQHLIVSIGHSAYVALPKGPLVPGHVLVIPIEHIASSVDAPAPVLEECQRYIDALRQMAAQPAASGGGNERQEAAAAAAAADGQELVVFERVMVGLRAPQHMHFQVVPVPRGITAELQRALQAVAPFDPYPTARDARANAGLHGHLIVELPNRQALLATGRLAPNLARDVLARVLGIPERADWKACAGSKDAETAEASAFRARFAPFDFMSAAGDEDL